MDISAMEMQRFVGERAILAAEGLKVEVVVVDVKQAYGCLRLRVEPVAGSGQVWVDIKRLEFPATNIEEELGL